MSGKYGMPYTEAAGHEITDAELHRFFRHFVLVVSDFGRQGSTADAADAERARHALRPIQADAASTLLAALRTLVQDTKDVAASFERIDMLDKLTGRFALLAARSLREDVDALARIAESTIGSIREDVGGQVVPRTRVHERLSQALDTACVVWIEGQRGTGKSALLRQYAEQTRDHRSSLVCLAADRLEHRSWTEFATAHGLSSIALAVLLDEIASVGAPILCLDAIDRVEPNAIALVREILRGILECKTCKHWRIVATTRGESRQAALQQLPELQRLESHPSVVPVGELDDEEASWLAEAHPSLGQLLLSDSPARGIARRPFFAQVLLEVAVIAEDEEVTASLVTERDLMAEWWRRGGHDTAAVGTGGVPRER